MTIKAILFDIDGVLLHPWKLRIYLEHEVGITQNDMDAFFDGPYIDCLMGVADLREQIVSFLSQWGYKGTLNEFLTLWFEGKNIPNVEVLEWAATLKERGYNCCIATNQEKYRLQYMIKKMNLEELFYDVYSSCDIGAMKPSSVFYKTVQIRLGLASSEILFIDDSMENVMGAKQCGWQAHQFTGIASLERTFKKHLTL